MLKRIVGFLMAVAFVAALAGCGGGEPTTPTKTPTPGTKTPSAVIKTPAPVPGGAATTAPKPLMPAPTTPTSPAK